MEAEAVSAKIYSGDWIEVLRTLPDESVQCCVTSPPYFGLRNYGVQGQFGLEPTVKEYVARMVEGMREVRRVLRADGTLWLNLGDSYAGSGRGIGDTKTTNNGNPSSRDFHDAMVDQGAIGRSWVKPPEGLKCKDLIGIPWECAFALRSDGWYLRQDIIWSKPNPMPESVRDRCTKSHEYIFLLSKSERYYYDGDGISEPLASDPESWGRHSKKDPGLAAVNARPTFGPGRNGRDGTEFGNGETRNKRSVWNVGTTPFPEAHFATFPPEIPETCIKAGTKEGDTVLDPFNGAGTTGLVATRLNRNYIGIELNPEYVEMAQRRIVNDAPMFNSVELL
jgi:DNA modification methylase